MKNYLIILAILVVVGCINKGSKGHYRYTVNREQNLFIEVYSAGLTGNLTSEYLTDSTNFRVYIGTFDDEGGYYSYKINGDTIYIEKRQHSFDGTGEIKITDHKTLSLKRLKRERLFE